MAGNADNLLLKVGDPGSATTLDANYTAGDSSITVVSTSNWTATGEGVIFAMDTVTVVDGEEVQDAGSYNEFEGTVASATSITNVDWVRGSGDTNYTAGSTTRVYIPVSAERENRIVDWGIVEHNQDGTHSDITATTVTADEFIVTGGAGGGGVGWDVASGTHSVATGYNAGNRSFTIDTSSDNSSFLSPGMRYKVTRGTTPPTQCADLEASSSHYASKSSPTGITFTDDFTCEAWIKLESYADNAAIVSRWNGTSGFIFDVQSDGTLRMFGDEGANSSDHRTYQSIPLNKWVHVAATMDLSGNASTMWIDGVSVPVEEVTNAASAIVQAGDLNVGSRNSGGDSKYFDGKLADVRVWSDARTETEIQDNMYNYPSDTTGLVAHFKLNGDFTDASSNGNDLTAQNSAVATGTDNPWNATEYGIITAVSASDIQVFCPEGYGIPNETISSPYYSTQATPYGFPKDKGKWEIIFYRDAAASYEAASATGSWQHIGSGELVIPVGAWEISWRAGMYCNETSGTSVNIYASLSTSTSAETLPETTTITSDQGGSTNRATINSTGGSTNINLSSATSHYLITRSTAGDTIRVWQSIGGDIKAKCAYL